MDMLKIISRGQNVWQCYCQTRNLSSVAKKISTWNANNSMKISSPLTLLNGKGSVNTAPRIVWNSTQISEKEDVSGDKTAESTAAGQEESGGEVGSEEEGASIVSSSKSQTGEKLPSEKDESDWNNKVDKLYKVVELEVLAYEPSVLDSYQWFVLASASHLGIQVGKVWSPLKPMKMRFPLLKSAFVHKKHQVQYEVRTHHRFITLHKLTSSTADTYLEYIERNLPEGVGLKVTRVEAKALPDYLQQQH